MKIKPEDVQGVSFDDKIFGLDISSTCVGWGLVQGDYHITGHLAFGGQSLGEKLKYFRGWLIDLITQWRPAVVGYEQPFWGKPNAAAIIYRFHGVFDEAMSDYLGALHGVHGPTWKSKVCGKGNITTAQKEAGLVLELLDQQGFRCQQIDEGDALAVALCTRLEITGRLK